MSLSAYPSSKSPTAALGAIPVRKKRRTSTPKSSGVVANGQKTPASTLGPAKQLGQAVRARRQTAGWTIAEAAAWCGVGTRFLLDLELGKSTVQIDRSLAVAERFGIDFQIKPRSATAGQNRPIDLAATVPPGPRWVDVHAPTGCANSSLWLGLCHAAHFVAGGCGLSVLPCTPIRQSGRLTHLRTNVSAWNDGRASSLFDTLVRRTDKADRSPWSQPATSGLREEEGGPGIEAAVHFFQQHAAVPMVDIANLLRWVVLSNVLLDTDHHLGRLRVLEVTQPPGGGTGLRPAVHLAPFGELMCASGLFEAKPHLGLRIGSVWPELHLRADHWKRLADVAGVHPKVIFQMMRELSVRVPGLLEQAFELSLGAIPTHGQWVDVMQNIRVASTRMSDLALAASRHVSGLSTRTQPKVEPVATRLVIQNVKRILPVIDDE